MVTATDRDGARVLIRKLLFTVQILLRLDVTVVPLYRTADGSTFSHLENAPCQPY